MMLHSRVTSQSRRSRRSGLATVEFAVCLPVLITLVFGAIEASNAIFLKQALTASAYETARTVTATGGTQAAAENRFNQIVTSRGLKQCTVSISPPVTSITPAGTLITVSVTSPASANSYAPALFFKNTSMHAIVRMVRL